jgi:hypothetical protein
LTEVFMFNTFVSPFFVYVSLLRAVALRSFA